jgi:hypothetical protein
MDDTNYIRPTTFQVPAVAQHAVDPVNHNYTNTDDFLQQVVPLQPPTVAMNTLAHHSYNNNNNDDDVRVENVIPVQAVAVQSSVVTAEAEAYCEPKREAKVTTTPRATPNRPSRQILLWLLVVIIVVLIGVGIGVGTYCGVTGHCSMMTHQSSSAFQNNCSTGHCTTIEHQQHSL